MFKLASLRASKCDTSHHKSAPLDCQGDKLDLAFAAIGSSSAGPAAYGLTSYLSAEHTWVTCRPEKNGTGSSCCKHVGSAHTSDPDFRARHGQGIARAIQQTSDDELLVEHGALYPALQRLEENGWIAAKWGVSENNRKARFYALTKQARKQLDRETAKWTRLATATGRILGSASGEG